MYTILIIPFDANNRTPQDRASMLHELGIQKLAYDWRNEQLTTFPHEIEVLRDNNIELTAVWFWIDEHFLENTPAEIDYIIKVLAETNTRTTIWAGFSDTQFDDYCIK